LEVVRLRESESRKLKTSMISDRSRQRANIYQNIDFLSPIKLDVSQNLVSVLIYTRVCLHELNQLSFLPSHANRFSPQARLLY